MFSVVLETKSLKFWLLNRTCGEKARRDSPVAVGFWPLTFCHRETGPHFSTVPSRRFSQSLAVLTRRLALAGRRSPRSVGSPSRPPSERTPANVSLDLFRLGSVSHAPTYGVYCETSSRSRWCSAGCDAACWAPPSCATRLDRLRLRAGFSGPRH